MKIKRDYNHKCIYAGLLLHFIVLTFFFNVNCASGSDRIPFSRGVNLTGWFQAGNVEQIQFTRYTKLDFEQIKGLGCDVIRLPINLHYMTKGAPDYTIEPLFYSFLDEVIEWVEDLQLYLILDNHTFDPATNTDPNVGNILLKVWPQIAQHYKDRSEYILYEVLNEPHGITDAAWNSIQQQVVNAIRETDTVHYIVIGPAGWNSYNYLDDMSGYHDSKLIYTFHFYDPFIFTHQGASWVEPSMAPLNGVPFPYKYCCMPDFPSSLKGTWIESAFNDYQHTGTIASVQSLLNIAVAFKNSHNVPLYCGEFGVYIPNSRNEHRIYWYYVVRKYLEEHGIPWTTWDYHGGFGLFEAGAGGMFEHDLNTSLLDTLGLTVPAQTEFVRKPDSTGFMLYTDYIGNRIYESSYGSGTLRYYAEDAPNNGKYCIYWTNAARYNTIGFDFSPDKDLSVLANEGYALDFMVRGNVPSTSFDIRFVDTKTTDPGDHPWRRSVTIDQTRCSFDNRWHHVHIPLSAFQETGAWDNAWFGPQGEFDWMQTDRFEIVSEQQDMIGKNLWFDNIHVTNQDTARVLEESVFSGGIANQETDDLQFTVFPNPASDYLMVSGDSESPLELHILDMFGRIRIQCRYHSGMKVNVSQLPAGIYYMHIFHNDLPASVIKILII
jgi:endoglucanase